MRGPRVAAVLTLCLLVSTPIVAAAAEGPSITASSPDENGFDVGLSKTVSFSVDADDPDTDRENLTVEWYVDDELAGSGWGLSYDAAEYGHGTHTVLAVVSDGDPDTDDARQSWSLDVYHPPEITDYGPGATSIQRGQTAAVDFFVDVADPDSSLSASDVTWYVDGYQEATGESFPFYTDEYASGSHTVEVVVADGTPESDDATRSWTVEILEPPRITDSDPGGDEVTVPEDESRTFSVDATDPDTSDDGLVTNWYVDGAITASGPQFAFDASEYGPGTHAVSAVVSDGAPATASPSREWSVSVRELPEISIVQPEPSGVNASLITVLPGEPVEFVAEASAPGGEVESVHWTIGEETYSGRSVTTTFRDTRDRTVTATVETTAGLSRSTTKVVSVGRASPLVTQLQPGSIELLSGETLTLYANATDRFGRSLSYTYRWSWAGNNYTGQTTTIGPLRRIGRHAITLSVANEYGARTSESFGVFVENTPPTISVDETRLSVESGETVRFPARIVDADRTNVAVQYYLDNRSQPFHEAVLDGTADGATAEASRAFTEPGSHVVTLRAADGHGTVAERVWRVSVDNEPPSITEATPTSERLSLLSGTSREFSVRAADPESAPVSYQWYYDGSPAGTGPSFAPLVNASGQHNVTVVARDGDGGRTARTWTVAASSFRTAPVVTNQSTQAAVSVATGSTSLLTVTVRNPDSNRRTARVEVVLEPIDGITYQEVSDAREASPSSIVTYSDVEPGGQEHLSVRVTVDESLEGERVEIPYTIRYYPVENQGDRTTIEDGSIRLSASDGSAGGGGPGFGVLAAVAALAAVVAVLRWR